MSKLDKEEIEILEAFERGELKSSAGRELEIKKHKEYAASTFRKDKRVNVQISVRDLNALKKCALSEGISYQSFISSLLHKYIDGRLIEKMTEKSTNSIG